METGASVERIRHYEFWFELPPEPSPKMAKWVGKVRGGWRPNSRIAGEGRDACAGIYDIYQAEWFVLAWIMRGYVGGPPEPEIARWMAEHFPQ